MDPAPRWHAARASVPALTAHRKWQAEAGLSATGLGIFSLLGGLFMLLGGGRALRCDADSLTLASGRRIPFAQIMSIDLRKWDKGIGRLECRDETNAAKANDANDGNGAKGATSVRIDDYKYVGSAEILRRVYQTNPAVTIEGDRRWLWPEAETTKNAAD